MALSPSRRGRIVRELTARATASKNDHDQARRENRKPKLATSQTERSRYSSSVRAVAHGSVNAALRPHGGTNFPAMRLLVLAVTKQAVAQSFTHGLHSREQTMSIFGKIMGAIFGSKAGAAPAGTGAGGAAAGGAGSAGAQPSQEPSHGVDVAAIVDKAAAAKGEKLQWRTSIVDLMKALDIDSSFTARKELAKELGYTGDSSDSANMNIWLHKQVMAKLAANGGKLPPEIKH